MLALLGLYDGPASRYHAEVASRKGASLKEKMLDTGYALFLQQIRKVSEASNRHADELATALQPNEARKGKTKQVHFCAQRILRTIAHCP